VAHVLGLIATKIDGSGAWISAASLDRYLLNTGKPQIFGLDLSSIPQPFNSKLITDTMRAELCVPSVADREKLLAAIKKDPENLPMVDPCSKDPEALMRSMLGEWRLTAKLRSGFRQYTFRFTTAKDGVDFDVSGPTVPQRAKRSMTLGGDKITLSIGDEVFEMARRGDIITGELRSGTESGPLVGVR